MTMLLAFIAGAVCAALLILLARRGAGTPSIPGLAELQHAVQQIRFDQQGDSGELRGLVKGVVDQQEQLVRQTGLLSEALRRPGLRGQWGETTLRQVVEAAGLAEHFDFDTQTHLAGDGEGPAARPDLVVHLPGGGCVPVDAKVPLDAFLDAAAAETPAAREHSLDEHVKQVRAKVRELAAKAYWNRFARAPEMVVMFMASEAAFAAALQRGSRERPAPPRLDLRERTRRPPPHSTYEVVRGTDWVRCSTSTRARSTRRSRRQDWGGRLRTATSWSSSARTGRMTSGSSTRPS
jgi:hypothetical protein